MPRKNSTAWSVGNGITSARLNAFNADIDDLYSTGSDRMKIYRLTTDPALQVTIGAGTYRVGGTEGQYAGGTVTVSVSSTTYIMLNTSGVIQTSTTAWNAQYAKIGKVVSNASAITSIEIWRNDLVGGTLGGLSFNDIRGSGTTPNDYNDFSFKAQFKSLTDIGLNGIATGTYARLIGGRGWSDSSGGYSFETAYTDDGIYHRKGSTTTWESWRKNIDATNVGSGLITNGTFTSVSAVTYYVSGPFTANSSSVLISKPTIGKLTASFGYSGGHTQYLQSSPDNSTWSNVYSLTAASDFNFLMKEGLYYRVQSNAGGSGSYGAPNSISLTTTI